MLESLDNNAMRSCINAITQFQRFFYHILQVKFCTELASTTFTSNLFHLLASLPLTTLFLTSMWLICASPPPPPPDESVSATPSFTWVSLHYPSSRWTSLHQWVINESVRLADLWNKLMTNRCFSLFNQHSIIIQPHSWSNRTNCSSAKTLAS